MGTKQDLILQAFKPNPEDGDSIIFVSNSTEDGSNTFGIERDYGFGKVMYYRSEEHDINLTKLNKLLSNNASITN